MSTAGYAFVDADDDFGGDAARSAGNGLEFQNFPSEGQGSTQQNKTIAPDAAPRTSTAPFSPFNLTYYQPYFSITTSTLLHRLSHSLLPRPGAGDFLSTTCAGEVDLYGPFWTLTTLIFTIYLGTSLSASISAFLAPSSDNPPTQDLTLLSVATTLIYTYGILFPALIWAATRWLARSGGDGFSTGEGQGILGHASSGGQETGAAGWRLVDALAVWGYAMSAYVPVSILCVIPVPILRWILVGGAALSSGYFLWINVYPILAGPDNKNLRLLMIVIIIVHLSVAIAMKVLFFSYAVGGKIIGPDDTLGGGIVGGGGTNTDVDGVLDGM
ncbi:hypothetical protein NliqN6_5199 [Naganishia liquefaciens]|uniref:Protein YIP n=1 Tax=Naganishia liquefaciens TaxID=104408 RepID=A0A8H3YI32_9TREE|nr:hypothetical protein NliqN6_5199 [Naganishia liquefaciens]